MTFDHPDLQRVAVDGREFLLVGTAHVSRESVELAQQVIEAERPDCVCLELDAARLDALSDPDRFAKLDLFEVMRRNQLPALMANLVLASYQRRLGQSLGVTPGAEMLQGAQSAETVGARVALVDRDVRITLKRAWNSLSLWRRSMLLGAVFGAMFEEPEVGEDELRDLRRNDAPTLLATQLAEVDPRLKTVLLDERDEYMAEKIRAAEGKKVVALVGAGHVRGLAAALASGKRASLPELETVPPAGPWGKIAGWSIPAAIIASILWVGWTRGFAAAGELSMYWVMITGVPCALGAVAAMGHPATIASAFASAPITTLSPLIGAGYVTAFAQLYFRPPLIGELHTVSDDIAQPRRWWGNRLLRIFLVFLLTNIGASIGTFVGGANIVSGAF